MDPILKSLQNEPHILELLPILKKNRCKAYLVGGYLRNLLLEKKDGNLDLDFAVSGDALKIAKLFSHKIKGFYVVLDKKERCARVVHNFGTEIYTLDFAQFRGKTIKEDLGLRDFTVNNLAIDIEKISSATTLQSILIDQSCGRKDLAAKIIRMVSKNSFKDDPLRIIRCFSLSAQLDFTVDKDTLIWAKKERERMIFSVNGTINLILSKKIFPLPVLK